MGQSEGVAPSLQPQPIPLLLWSTRPSQPSVFHRHVPSAFSFLCVVNITASPATGTGDRRGLDVSLRSAVPPADLALCLIVLTHAMRDQCASQILLPNRRLLKASCVLDPREGDAREVMCFRTSASSHPPTPWVAFPMAQVSAEWGLPPPVSQAACMILGLSFHICKWGWYMPGTHLDHA